MRVLRRSELVVSVSVGLLSLNAFAADTSSAGNAVVNGRSPFTISGFGTVGVVRTNTDDAQYARINQRSGADRSADMTVDSTLGVQATWTANEWLSATGQLLSQKGIKNNFVPQVEWAFVKAKVSDNLSVRVGRIGLPAYAASDYRNVGYANTWLRPPIEVYNLQYNHFDGADVLYRTAVGDTTIVGQVVAGRSSAKILGVGGAVVDTDLKNMFGANLSVETGPVTLRAGHIQAKYHADSAAIDRLTAGISSLTGILGGTQYNALAEDLRLNGKTASFSGVGVNVDWRNMLFQGEYTIVRSDSISIPERDQWYTTFGYRIGKWTPYATYSTVRVVSPRTNSTIPRLSPQLVAMANGVNALAAGAEQTSKSIGVRYDFHSSAALKVQFDRVTPKNGAGQFVHPEPGFTGPVNVISAAVDFVF